MASADPFADIGTKADDPFADIGTSPSIGKQALDVAKQIPAGLVAGTEAIAAFPAQIAGMVAPLANRFLPSDPEAERRQAELRTLTAKQRGGGIADYLPKPETTAGEYARTAAEFVPAAVAGSRMSVPRAVGVGATAGLTSEAAGQATKGTDLEPYARAAGGLVAGVGAGRLAEGAATRAAINQVTAGTEAAANRGYASFRGANLEFEPAIGAYVTTPLRTQLNARGLTPRTADQTYGVLHDIERAPPTTPTQLQDRYKELGSVARKAQDSEERLAAHIAQERLLQFAENPPPWIVRGGDPAVVEQLRNANANWAALQRAENLSQRVTASELRAGANYSGMNLENELRRRVGGLANPNVRAGISDAEREQIARFAQGTIGSNTRRYVTNLVGGRGGLGALAGAGTGAAGLGAYFGLDPVTGAGLTGLAGLGLAKYSNMRALNRARELELMLLQRSPYARQTGVPGTSSGVPYSLAAPTLATLGGEQ